MDKLYHHDFRGIIHKWFSFYLQGRTQTTQIGAFISPEKKNLSLLVFHKVLSWVHCFFLSILTISKKDLKSFNFFLFADDTNILYADSNLKLLKGIVNLELHKLCDWLMAINLPRT